MTSGPTLLPPAFPGFHPKKLKEETFISAFNLPNESEVAGLLQYNEALNALLSSVRHKNAKRAICCNAQNGAAQREGSHGNHAPGLALAFIRYQMIADRKHDEALKEPIEIDAWPLPSAMIYCEEQIKQIMESCPRDIKPSVRRRRVANSNINAKIMDSNTARKNDPACSYTTPASAA